MGDDAREAHVQQASAGTVARRHEDAVGGQAAVDDALVVGVRQRVEQVEGEPQGRLGRQGPGGERLAQGLPLGDLLEQVGAPLAVVGAAVEHAHEARVLERRDRLEVALERTPRLGVADGGGVERDQDDLAARRVLDLLRQADAARAQLGLRLQHGQAGRRGLLAGLLAVAHAAPLR
ncbi:MAG: hypothetical protein M9894_37310 [Planctomycetes bacterium]|nr:hypothetical protein [Planctomycetota bacterium]